MVNGKADDVISKKKQNVPTTGILLAGFPYTSETKLSSQLSENAYCIQKTEGDTGKGYEAHARKHADR